MPDINGFTYNGVHCSQFHCGFAPGAADRFGATTAEYEIQDADIAGRDGGYYYGNRLKNREFTLECWFEGITANTRERMFQWLGRHTRGRLIFDDRPFVFYDVRPVKRLAGKIYTAGDGIWSGAFSVTFKAHCPFGHLLYNAYDGADTDGAGEYTGILDIADMPPAVTTASRDFLLYNCGTEACDTVIRISGTAADGITIRNRANGNTCVLKPIPPGSAGYLEIDSATGTVELVSATGREDAYEAHDGGYIMLEPGGFYDTERVSTTDGSNTIRFTEKEPADLLIDGYLVIDHVWYRVLNVLAGGDVVLNKTVPGTATLQAKLIGNVNDIEIVGDNITLDRLEIEYRASVT